MLFEEGKVEIQRFRKTFVGKRLSEDEIVEMGITVPCVVIIEESPVYAVLAENTFDLTHLPTQLF